MLLEVGKLYKVSLSQRRGLQGYFSQALDDNIVLVVSATEGLADSDLDGDGDRLHPLPQGVTEHYKFLCKEKLFEISIRQHVAYDEESHAIILGVSGEHDNLSTALFCNDTAHYVLVPDGNGPIFELIGNNNA